MAGTIPFSLSQQLDRFGKPLSGGLLYLIQAGTTSTPQNGYQDSGLTIALPNPIPCDAAGRLPQFFLADGLIKVRLVDSDGVQQIVADGIQVIGPSSGGGGGGGSVDPTTIFQTGDVLWLDASGTRTGWVRDNGRTIGSASSGATERANSDCQALFGFLWQKYPDTICPVAGGRGASAADDWSSNRTIQLPDKRGYVPGGLSDMGNTDIDAYAGAPVVAGSDTTPGGKVGEVSHALSVDEIPEHKHDNYLNDPGHRHNDPGDMNLSADGAAGGSTIAVYYPGSKLTDPATTGITITNVNTGGGGVHNNVQRTVLGTFYRKL
jgi:hypothetical protein